MLRLCRTRFNDSITRLNGKQRNLESVMVLPGSKIDGDQQVFVFDLHAVSRVVEQRRIVGSELSQKLGKSFFHLGLFGVLFENRLEAGGLQHFVHQPRVIDGVLQGSSQVCVIADDEGYTLAFFLRSSSRVYGQQGKQGTREQ